MAGTWRENGGTQDDFGEAARQKMGLNRGKKQSSCEVTIQISDKIVQAAKSAAQSRGQTTEEWVESVVSEKLEAEGHFDTSEVASPSWLGLFGAFEEEREEIHRIQTTIDEEFGQIDPLER